VLIDKLLHLGVEGVDAAAVGAGEVGKKG